MPDTPPTAPPLRLTRAQVREVDRRSIEDYGIPGIVLMENAARAAFEVLRDALPNLQARRIAILCGGGNNGGDGLAIARHLHNAGCGVSIGLYVDPTRYKGDALINWNIVQAMKLPTFPATPQTVSQIHADWFVDALFGTGLTDPPRDPFADVARAIAATQIPVLAVDLPSGLDCDTGAPLGETVRATRTVTFVAEKAGFANPAAKPYLGTVTVGDIGCPRELIQQIAGEEITRD